MPDLATTARLHIAYLGNGLFPRLGPSFVRRWHRTFIDDPNACGYVTTDQHGQIMGFLLGALDQAAYVNGTLRRDRLSLGLHGATSLILRPGVAASFLRTRSGTYARRLLAPGPARTQNPGGPAATGPVAVLHAIVTVEAARGTGLGRRLLGQFVADVAATPTRRIELITDADNEPAVAFYRKAGWTQGRIRGNRDGRQVIEFDYQLTG